MATPAPTPWTVSAYSPSPGVEGFQSLPRYGPSEFPVEDVEDMNYWQAIVVNAGIPVACMVLSVFFYFCFLCCRNACCSACCKRCKTCTDILFGCGCKQLCCPTVNMDIAIHDGGHPKSPDHCIHNPLCKGRPLSARFALLLVFVAVGLVNIQIDKGLVEVQNAFGTVADICDDIGDTFQDFIDEAKVLKVATKNISVAAEGLENTCTFSEVQDSAAEIVSYSDDASSAARQIEKLMGNLPQTMNDVGDAIRRWASGTDYQIIRLALMIGSLFSILGAIGVFCFESKSCLFRCSSSVLSLTSTIGLILLLVISACVFVETGLGLVISDSCYANPSEVVVALSNEHLGADPAETVEYFLMCNQENPADQYYDEAMDAVDDINVTLSTLKKVATADQLCCDSNNMDSYTSVEAINSNCFYSSCDPNNVVCTLPDNTQGFCLDGSGCSIDDYNTVHEKLLYVLGENGPLEGIYGLLSCKTVNEPITKLLNVALCDDAINGLYLLWETHVGVMIAIYVAMFLISYFRQAIVGKPCFGGGDDSQGTADFKRPWDTEEDYMKEAFFADGVEIPEYKNNSNPRAHKSRV